MKSHNNINLNQLNFYQNSNSDYEYIKKNFVIRTNEFHDILQSISSRGDKDSRQHELILGSRGSGKSTLLKRIEIEINENKYLKKRFIVINFAEEQLGIFRLFDLWIEIISELNTAYDANINPKAYDNFDNDNDYTNYMYGLIHNFVIERSKKLVLLIDNFDRVVENFSDDGRLLRATLINYNDVQIIGGSTRMGEHFWRYDMPFYEFFRIHKLQGLSKEEMITLFNHWADSFEISQLKDFVKNNPGKLENIRLLTDGLPRTMQFFIQIVLQNKEENAYEYLKKIMDEYTPLYQERLNSLTAPLRKIVNEMAFFWEAVSTKQLVTEANMQSKLISAHLNTLIEKGIVEKLNTSTKNNLYRLSERFFNLWIIITQGKPEQKRRARWLSIFFENWYDEKEMKMLLTEHLNKLHNKNITIDKAIMTTKALAQSKYISTKQRDEVLEESAPYFTKNNKDPMFQLPKKFNIIIQEISKLLDNKEYDKALNKANEIENEDDGVKFYILGLLYDNKGELKEAEKYYLKASEKENVEAMFNLAILYYNQEKWELAEKYYLKAIDNGDLQAMNNLASLYKNQEKWELAEKYFLKAIKKEDVKAMNNLAILYENQEKWELAEKYYLKAIEKGVVEAMYNLASFYEYQEKWELAEEYYLKAIDNGDLKAIYNLAIFYYMINKNKKDSLELIKKSGVQRKDLLIIFELWNGIFDNIEQKISDCLTEKEYDNADFLIKELLVHQQIYLVKKFFEHEIHGKHLRDRYIVLYYVFQLLSSTNDKILALKIPPELQSTIDDVLKYINERQIFYGYIMSN